MKKLTLMLAFLSLLTISCSSDGEEPVNRNSVDEDAKIQKVVTTRDFKQLRTDPDLPNEPPREYDAQMVSTEVYDYNDNGFISSSNMNIDTTIDAGIQNETYNDTYSRNYNYNDNNEIVSINYINTDGSETSSGTMSYVNGYMTKNELVDGSTVTLEYQNDLLIKSKRVDENGDIISISLFEHENDGKKITLRENRSPNYIIYYFDTKNSTNNMLFPLSYRRAIPIGYNQHNLIKTEVYKKSDNSLLETYTEGTYEYNNINYPSKLTKVSDYIELGTTVAEYFYE